MSSNALIILLFVSIIGTTSMSPQASVATNSSDLIDLISSAMKSEGVSGGIEVYDGCKGVAKRSYSIPNGTLDEKLAALRMDFPDLTWSKHKGTYRVHIGDNNSHSILQTRIASMKVDATNVEHALEQILDQPSVGAAIAATHLKLFAPSVGFAALKVAPGSASELLVLPTGTMADTLDRIAKESGQHVWLYSEAECSGERTGRLSWAIQ